MQQSPPAGQLHMQSTSGPVPPHVASEYAYRALAQDHAGSLQHTLNPSGMVPTPARRPSVRPHLHPMPPAWMHLLLYLLSCSKLQAAKMPS